MIELEFGPSIVGECTKALGDFFMYFKVFIVTEFNKILGATLREFY